MNDRQTSKQESGDEPDLVGADPENYNLTQRYRQIHDARRRVQNFLETMEFGDDMRPGEFEWNNAKRLAFLVSEYIIELQPLMKKKDWNGEEFIPESSTADDIFGWTAKVGHTQLREGMARGQSDKPAQVPAKPTESLRVFSGANQFWADVGLDIPLEADTGDHGFDYSDVLEEGPPGSTTPEIQADGGPEIEGGEPSE